MPAKTLSAFADHCNVARALDIDTAETERTLTAAGPLQILYASKPSPTPAASTTRGSSSRRY
jgi:hypothetical protein